MERVIRREAHAKINLFLRVLGRRDDGYHDIESLLVPISLADDVMVRAAPELRLSVRGHLADAVPLDESNLAVRAATVLAEACGRDPGAKIEIDKRIPVAAGLGGGSADAAAALVALNELWGCGLDGDALLALAAGIGSDVPAMVRGEPVLAFGRGEVLEPTEVARIWWVLLTQPFSVSTADAYRWWDEDGAPRGPAEGNDLEGPVTHRHPEIAEARLRLLDAGCGAAIMCGSGPTVAGRVASEEEARRIAATLPSSIAVAAPP